MKIRFCIGCADPIHNPQLTGNDKCCVCDEEFDSLADEKYYRQKQEAYAQGYWDSMRERHRREGELLRGRGA